MSQTRRGFLRSMTLTSALSLTGGRLAFADASRTAAATPSFSSIPPRTDGPRLLYTTAQARELAALATRDAEFGASWNEFLVAARKLTADAFVSESGARAGEGQHGNMPLAARQVSHTGFALGLAYQATGDRAWAERVRATLLHYAGYQAWVGPGFTSRPTPWNSELATAAMTFGFAMGYDAIAEILTDAERRTIREALINRGILPLLNDWVLPGRRTHALDSMGHNWWSVCIGMAGFGILAIADDEPRAAGWLAQVRTALTEFFTYSGNVLQNKPANFDPAGGLYEGVHYTEYGLAEYLRFRLAHRNVFGAPPLDDTAWLEGSANFLVDFLYPAATPLSVNFGDTHSRVGHAFEAMRLLAANGVAAAQAAWYLQQVETARPPAGTEPKQVFRLLFPTPPAIAPAPSRPLSAAYTGMGWAALRSSWENNATLLAVKSGDTWNHAHADAASFVLYHQGQPLLIDSGTCPYIRPEYRDFYFRSRAHNVVLVDGEGQLLEDQDRGAVLPGAVHSLLDDHSLRYVYADATGPMSHLLARNFRHWLWVGNVVLIIDDLLAHRAARFDWLLHHGGTAEPSANGTRLVNGAASATVRFLHPTTLDRVEEKGLAEGQPDEPRSFLRFSTREPARVAKFITAIILDQPGAPAPVIESLTGTDLLGVRIREAGKVTDVYLNLLADGRTMHLNSVHQLGPWSTDAYLLATTRAESADDSLTATETVLMVNGSFVRHGDQPVWESLSKAEAIFSPRDATRLQVHGQANAAVRLTASRPPATLHVNGIATDFVIEDGTTLRFQLGSRA